MTPPQASPTKGLLEHDLGIEGASGPPRRAALRSLVACVPRGMLAFLFTFGMLSAATRPLSEAKAESTVGAGKDGKGVARQEQEELGHLVRRPSRGGGQWVRTHAGVRPSRWVAPSSPAPCPPRWQRPRRFPPPGDDHDDASIG